MGAARKLQAEIDRTLKKVQEGIAEFDQTWVKVYDTESQSQREKYEADLKKEIKKLQRLRDQIKTWIAGSEIKDKSALMEARKSIEKEMERFKLCEKEAKTKAFSKAGLGQAAKLDPEEKKRQEAREWLNEQVEALQMQIDEFEAELEAINGTKRGKKPQQRQQTLEELVVRHKNHITRLEQCMRCLDNGTVTHEEIEDLKDSVEYYVQECEDEDAGFESVDDTYSDLLDRLNDVTLGLQSANISAKVKKPNDVEEEQAEREREKERAAAAAVKAQLLSSHGSNVSTLLEAEEKKTPARSVPIAANATQPKRRVSMSEIPTGNHLSEDLDDGSPTKSNVLGTSLTNNSTNGSLSFASAAAGRNTTTTPNTTSQTTTTSPISTTAVTAPSNPHVTSLDGAEGEDGGEFPKLGGSEKAKSLDLSAADGKTHPKRMSLDTTATSTLKANTSNTFLPVPALHGLPESSHRNISKPAIQEPNRVNNHGEKTMGFKAAVLGGCSSASSEGGSASNDPLLSVLKVDELISSLGMSCAAVTSMPMMPGQFEGNPAASQQLLQACSRRAMPQPADRDYRTQLSQNTARGVVQQLPASFPIHRLPQLEDPVFYQKLDVEGLFYAFHFLPGDIAQYCAAKELKRQSWRYNVDYKAWFQRSGEPKASTADYEEGSYMYFDSQISAVTSAPPSSSSNFLGEAENATNGWSYRVKDNFVFRYDQLEDELR